MGGIGRRLAPAGLVACALGYLGLGVVAGDGTWSDAAALPLLLLAGAGFGAGYSQVIMRSIAGVPAAQAHDASGLYNTINMLGFALGIATLGSAFLSGASIEAVLLGCAALSAVAVVFVLALARAEAPSVRVAAQAEEVRETIAA